MKIQSTLKKVKDCSYSLTVEIPAEEVNAEFDSVLRSIRRKVKLSGFRPGKAPLDIVEKMYLGQATEEVAQNLIQKGYVSGIREHGAKALTQPEVKDLSEIQRGKKVKFVAEFDVAPEIKLKKYKGFKITRPSEKVPDAEIEKSLKSLQESRATVKSLEAPRAVQEGDVIQAGIEIYREGKLVRPKEDTSFPVTKVEGREQLFDSLIGANKDEVREVNFEDEKVVYKIEIKEIKERELPELTDEFAKDFGKESLDELKEEIRKDISRHLRQQSREKMKNQVFDQLVAQNQFKVSEAVIDQQAQKLSAESGADLANRDGLNDEQKRAFEDMKVRIREQAEKQIRLFFLLEAVADEEKIEIDEADYERRINEAAQYSGKDKKKITEEQGDDIRYHLKQDKIIDLLIAESQIEDEAAAEAK